MSEIVKAIAHGTMKVSIVGGGATSAFTFFGWIESNAIVLGLLISASGVVVTGIYYYFMARKQQSKDINSHRLDKLESLISKDSENA